MSHLCVKFYSWISLHRVNYVKKISLFVHFETLKSYTQAVNVVFFFSISVSSFTLHISLWVIYLLHQWSLVFIGPVFRLDDGFMQLMLHSQICPWANLSAQKGPPLPVSFIKFNCAGDGKWTVIDLAFWNASRMFGLNKSNLIFFSARGDFRRWRRG